MTPEEIDEHNRLYNEANFLVRDKILIEGRQSLPPLEPSVRQYFNRAIALYERVLELNPSNWSAMWFQGKVYQRLEDHNRALAYFARAHKLNPAHPDLAREASLAAMHTAHPKEAVDFANRALECRPSDEGLRANLALALLLAGRIDEAYEIINSVMAKRSADTTTKNVHRIVSHFLQLRVTPPDSLPLLSEYWTRTTGEPPLA